jgi:hypothetical protein
MVALANFRHDMAHHLLHGVAMVAVLAPSPEHRIDDESPPGHLKRLESLDPLVGWLHSVPSPGIIIIHHHRVDPQLNQPGLRKLQPPQEELLKEVPEEPYAIPREPREESLHRSPGQHGLPFRLDRCRIPRISLQRVEVGKTPAGAIQKETEQLLEDFRHGLSLAVFSDAPEQPLKMGKDVNALKISYKKGETATGGQSIRSHLNGINLTFTPAVLLSHNGLLPFGFALNHWTIGKIST